MIYFDLKMPSNEIGTPSLYYMKDVHSFFLIGGFK